MIRRSLWKEVLDEIYVMAPSTYFLDNKTQKINSITHEIAKKRDIRNGQKLQEALSFLQEQKLIEIIPHIKKENLEDSYSDIKITNEGFKIAVHNEQILQQQKHDEQNLSFTKILTLAASIQALWLLFVFFYKGEQFIYSTALGAILTMVLILIIAYLLVKLIDGSINAFRKQ